MKQLHFHRYAEAEKDFKEALAIDPSREESKKALIKATKLRRQQQQADGGGGVSGGEPVAPPAAVLLATSSAGGGSGGAASQPASNAERSGGVWGTDSSGGGQKLTGFAARVAASQSLGRTLRELTPRSTAVGDFTGEDTQQQSQSLPPSPQFPQMAGTVAGRVRSAREEEQHEALQRRISLNEQRRGVGRDNGRGGGGGGGGVRDGGVGTGRGRGGTGSGGQEGARRGEGSVGRGGDYGARGGGTFLVSQKTFTRTSY